MEYSLKKLEDNLETINKKIENNNLERQELIKSHQLIVKMIIEIREKLRDISQRNKDNLQI